MAQSVPFSWVDVCHCKLFGIELEGFSREKSCVGFPSVPGGHFEDDAGWNLCELITAPQRTIREAFAVLEQLQSRGETVEFLPHRPAYLMGNSGRWQDKAKYKVVLEALRREAPLDWSRVNRMTDSAALQVNVSGDIQPFGPDGVFLVNVFNNIAPYFAATVHRETGLGKGHLSMWQQFARAERLPQADRWFKDPADMCQYIQSIPKLIHKIGEDAYAVDLVNKMDVNISLDLATLWWFLRTKIDKRIPYLEFRFLPSMPLALSEKYAGILIDVVECFLQWFHRFGTSQVIDTIDKAKLSYLFVSQRFPQYVPQLPLEPKEWKMLLVQ